MSGFLSTPKLPPAPPPLPTAPDPEEEARKRRLEMIERRRRGRAGTVVTSERGFLASAGAASVQPRKNLLGE
jgi:hypothetical protein